MLCTFICSFITPAGFYKNDSERISTPSAARKPCTQKRERAVKYFDALMKEIRTCQMM